VYAYERWVRRPLLDDDDDDSENMWNAIIVVYEE
jgi:hypothetical protein